MRAVRRGKDAFIRRLDGMVEEQGDCVVYLGCTNKATRYGRMSFRVGKGTPISIEIHRVFLILKLCRPIRTGYDSGHEPDCPHRLCVKHVFEQRSEENGRWAQAKRYGNDVPF